jgi:hypothetical protein
LAKKRHDINMARDNQALRFRWTGIGHEIHLRNAGNFRTMKCGRESVTVQMRTKILHRFDVALRADGVKADETARNFVQISIHDGSPSLDPKEIFRISVYVADKEEEKEGI